MAREGGLELSGSYRRRGEVDGRWMSERNDESAAPALGGAANKNSSSGPGCSLVGGKRAHMSGFETSRPSCVAMDFTFHK